MKRFEPTSSSSTSSAPVVTPSTCPACQSTLIVTTAKSPDADSYWRCTICGDVWNTSRLDAVRPGRRRWR